MLLESRPCSCGVWGVGYTANPEPGKGPACKPCLSTWGFHVTCRAVLPCLLCSGMFVELLCGIPRLCMLLMGGCIGLNTTLMDGVHRERADGLYAAITYLCAKLTEEIGLALIMSIIFSLAVFYSEPWLVCHTCHPDDAATGACSMTQASSTRISAAFASLLTSKVQHWC